MRAFEPRESETPKEKSMSKTASPYADVRGMYIVHAVVRREFALLPPLVREVAEDDKERSRLVADHIGLLLLMVHEHHSGEDKVLWPSLLRRAPKEVDPVVHLVEGHHQNIEAISLDVDALLTAWRDSPAGLAGESLAEALERLTAALYEHMRLEEELILPLVERHIFASEWEAMVADGVARIPLGLGPLVVGMLMYEGGQDALPPALHHTAGEAAQQAYAARARLLYGTATPPRSTDVVIGTPSVGISASARRN
jgi:hemerythrin-like domain-containing protein